MSSPRARSKVFWAEKNIAHLVGRKPHRGEMRETGMSTTPYERSDGNSNGCLKPGVAASFKSPLDCAEVCGGLTHEMVKRLTVQSNLYAEEVLKPQYVGGRVEGSPWKKITVAEMYRFLGLMLKISISPLNLGGYEAYFSNKFRTVTYDGIYKMDIDVNVGWAAKYMSLKRFRQVRRAFHPEHRAAAAAGDKCYQLRYALNCLNQASLNTYIPGRDLSFDEGGVSMRSRLCPVRQYNKDKPNKFRVDFFILADAKSYFAIHTDVYQGKNSTNVGIDPRLRIRNGPRVLKNDEEANKAVEDFLVQHDSQSEMSDVSHTIKINSRASRLSWTVVGASDASIDQHSAFTAGTFATSVINKSMTSGLCGRSRTQRRFRRALEKRALLYESGIEAHSFFRFDTNFSQVNTNSPQRVEHDEQSYLSKMDTDEVSLQSLALDGDQEDFIPKQFLLDEDEIQISCCGAFAWWKPNWIFCYFDKLVALSEWDFEMRRIMKLTIPFALQALFTGVLDVFTVAIVARMMGTREMAALTMAELVIEFSDAICGGFCEALATLCAQADGAKQYRQCGQYVQMAGILYVLSSLPFMYIWWAKTGDVIVWFGFDEATAQIGQEFAQIYIFAALVEGLADIVHELLDVIGCENYSTVIGISEDTTEFVLTLQAATFFNLELYHVALIRVGVYVAFLMLNLMYIARKGWFKPYMKGMVGSFSLSNHKAVWLMCKTASSLSFGYVLTDGEWEILTLLASVLGPAEVAAWNIIGTLWEAVEDLTEAIGDAAEVRCAFLLGAGKPAHAKVSAYKSMLIGTLIALLVTSSLFAAGENIAAWLTNDPVLQHLIVDLLPLFGIGNIAMTVGTMSWTLLGAQGRYRLATAIAFCGSWLITLPMAAVTSAMLNFDLQGQTSAIVVGYMVSGTINAYLLFRSDWETISQDVMDSHEAQEKTHERECSDDSSCSSSESDSNSKSCPESPASDASEESEFVSGNKTQQAEI
jgi:MATE family multidrug resistance protein